MTSARMRTARSYEPGQNLRIEEIPIPEPHGDEILVRVRAAGVCHTDVHILNGRIPLMPSIELPLTLGHDTAGEMLPSHETRKSAVRRAHSAWRR